MKCGACGKSGLRSTTLALVAGADGLDRRRVCGDCAGGALTIVLTRAPRECASCHELATVCPRARDRVPAPMRAALLALTLAACCGRVATTLPDASTPACELPSDVDGVCQVNLTDHATTTCCPIEAGTRVFCCTSPRDAGTD